MKELKKHFKIESNGVANSKAIVLGDKYRFTVLTTQLIRIEYNEKGIFEDRPTKVVFNRNFDVPSFRVKEDENRLEIITEHIHLYYNKGEFSGNSLYVDVVGSFNLHGARWYYGMEINDLKGTARTLDNINGAVELESGVISADGFTVTDDSNSQIITEEGWVEARNNSGIDIYFWGYGRDYFKCMKDYFKLTGSTPLVPRYALGNWWSRYWAYSEEEYKEVMTRFRNEDVPFSVSVIDMDWHVTQVEEKYGSAWTAYTWNNDLFPDPKRFIDWLHEKDLKVTLNLHPASGVRGFEEMYVPMAKELGVDYENEDPIPFDITNKDFLEAYFKYLHHPREEEGVDFWWIDWQQGNTTGIAGLDPLWMLNHYHYLDKTRNGERGLIFSRYAGLGSHRYPVGFSGDSIVTWESYEFQPYFTSTASNVGYCWWSHDIGGHMGGEKDDELIARWVQYGVFSPILRLHSSNSVFTGKEPWNYGMEAEKTMKEHLRLRHQLVPYIYTMNYKVSKELIPFIVPVYYYYPMEWDAYRFNSQYFFGSELMVSTIVRKMNPSIKLAYAETWIPEGTWFDFFDGTSYQGKRKAKLFRGLDRQVVLAKAGAIVPMAKHTENDNSIANPENLEIIVFPKGNNSFTLIEDEGTMVVQNESEFAKTELTLNWGNEKAEFVVNKTVGNTKCVPAKRNIKIMFRGLTEKALDAFEVNCSCEKSYDKVTKTVVIEIKDWTNDNNIVCKLNNIDTVNTNADFREKIQVLVNNAQISFYKKDDIFRLVRDNDDKMFIVSGLRNLDLEQDLFDALIELLV